ncbi:HYPERSENSITIVE RESPONSE-LIKE LESION 1, polyprenyltransferase 1 [Hibiscus trionum]|uniref:4-hydroxybenzoate polyprenyltransferase, mitochondrial n=1 Tax=Hibiscus trionum TaxID=183268 RepID=A0A9W7J1I1_HIBTR|nr:HYPERSENSITIVE RESPONSE-LIKE LESION 1, polyprenyltransferase 1 [Hibiscus trionum]
MASLSVSHAHLFSTHPTTRMLKHRPAFGTPSANPSLFSRKINSRTSQSSNYKTRVSRMTTIASSVGKDDRKLIGVQTDEEAVEVSSWVDYLPKEAQPYAKLARVDKPIGTWLFMFPLAWSSALAATAGSLPDFKTLAVVVCASPLLRGAACTINDFFDRDIDKMVERTKLRPLASGTVTPFQGLCFFGFQMLLFHGILLQLAYNSMMYEAVYLFLISTYPLMKRITYWPQAYLGLAINWGAILGWHAVKGSLQPSILFPLLLSGFFWTILSDTIYAHQDKEDDLKVGIKSTALKFGESSKEWITSFAIACIGSFALTGYNAALGWPFYACLAAASAQLAWQIWTVNLSSPPDCNQKFVSNKWFGAIIFSGMLLGRVFS